MDSIPRLRLAAPRAPKHHCTEWTPIGGGADDAAVNPEPQPFTMDPTARPNTRQRGYAGDSFNPSSEAHWQSH
jgi:hypothetical protein